MIKALELIANNPNKFQKLDDSQKELFFSMAKKFSIEVKNIPEIEENYNKSNTQNDDNTEYNENCNSKKDDSDVVNHFISQNEIENQNIKINEENSNFLNLKIPTSAESDKDKKISTENFCENKNIENNFNEKILNYNDKQIFKKKLSIVESEAPDQTDENVDDYLMKAYNKKKMSYIPMRRLSENNYEFGSQKIEIKIDEGIIRGN